MPEYDAFGREIGEDTLGGLGGSESSPEAPRPEPAAAPARGASATPEPPIAVPQPAQLPTFNVPVTAIPSVRRRRGSGLGCFVGLIILAAIVAGPVIAIVGLVGDAGDAIDDITGVIDSAGPTDEPGATDEAAQPPVGLAGASMVSKANFSKAIGRLRAAGIGRAVYVRLAPERLDAQVVKGSKVRSVQIRFDGGFNRGTPTPSGPTAATVSLAAIDPGAPARLVRASARRAGWKVKRIDYLVANASPQGGHHWFAYFRNGPFTEGDSSGRLLRINR